MRKEQVMLWTMNSPHELGEGTPRGSPCRRQALKPLDDMVFVVLLEVGATTFVVNFVVIFLLVDRIRKNQTKVHSLFNFRPWTQAYYARWPIPAQPATTLSSASSSLSILHEIEVHVRSDFTCRKSVS